MVVVAVAGSLNTSLFSLWVVELEDTLLYRVVLGAAAEVMLVLVTVLVVFVLVAFSLETDSFSMSYAAASLTYVNHNLT